MPVSLLLKAFNRALTASIAGENLHRRSMLQSLQGARCNTLHWGKRKNLGTRPYSRRTSASLKVEMQIVSTKAGSRLLHPISDQAQWLQLNLQVTCFA
jgi:hypothetical protein